MIEPSHVEAISNGEEGGQNERQSDKLHGGVKLIMAQKRPGRGGRYKIKGGEIKFSLCCLPKKDLSWRLGILFGKAEGSRVLFDSSGVAGTISRC